MTNQKRGASKLFKRVRDGWKPPSRKAIAGEVRTRGKPAREGHGRAAAALQGAAGSARAEPARPGPAGPREKLLPGARPLDPCVTAFAALRASALQHPGTYEQQLAGQTLVKLKNKSVVVSLGRDGGGLSVVCKLPRSGPGVVAKFSWASPAGHGLGRSGWVQARFERGDKLPLRMLLGWIEESFAAVAAPPRAG